MKKYKVGMIGCGKRAMLHVPALLADERCEVVGVCDINEEAAAAMSAEFGSKPVVYTDHKEMLENEKPEIVIGCLWTILHLSTFQDCVNAGVKVYHSEKPMAPSWGDCVKMGELAKSSGCQLTFSHQRRYCKGNIAVRKMIKDGVFGKILRMDLYSPMNLLDCGTHTFDQAISFMDETPAKWVLGAIDAKEPINWFGVSAESMAAGIVVFENGVRAHIQTGGPDLDMYTGVRVIGEKGFIEVEWDGGYLNSAVYADPSWKPEKYEHVGEETMAAMMKDFVDSYENGTEPEIDYKKGLRATEIIFAFYESVRQNSRIELPIDIDDNPFVTMLEAGKFN